MSIHHRRIAGAALAGLIVAPAFWTSAGAQPSPPPGQPTPNTGQNVSPPDSVLRSETIRNPMIEHPVLTLEQQEAFLDSRLEESLSEGTLARADYEAGEAALAAVKADEARLRSRHDGRLTGPETYRLQTRLTDLSKHIPWKRTLRGGPPAGQP